MASYNSFYNPNANMLNQLMRQKENIDNLINQYSQPQAPVQNIINTNSNIDFEAKILKDDEDISNIMISRKTLFIDEKNAKVYIKEIDGNISKTYDIIVPKDKKDIEIDNLKKEIYNLKSEKDNKISNLENEIIKLKQIIQQSQNVQPENIVEESVDETKTKTKNSSKK